MMFRSFMRTSALVAVCAAFFVALSAPKAWAQAVKRGGTLTAAMDLQPKSLDPVFGDAPLTDRRALNLFFENLFYLDDDGTPIAQLAESWNIAKDELSITFRLRKGIKFHDGTSFDAEAVKFNLERNASKELNAPHTNDLIDFERVDVIDLYTARVVLKRKSGAVIATLANEPGMMSSPAATKKFGKDYGRNPVGTGPFKFVEWASGDRVVGERFGEYWGKDSKNQSLPYLDRVVVRFISNTAVKILELRSGNIQVGDGVQVKDFAQIEADSNLKLVDRPEGIHQWLAFNVTKPPFDNKDLRFAVLHGIDRQAIMRVITGGRGQVTPTLEPPGSWIYTEALPVPMYSQELAKKSLAQSGFRGLITLSVIQRDPDAQIAQLIQHQLQAIGIQVKVEVMERQAWVDRVLGKNHEIGLLRNVVPRPDPDQTWGLQFGRNAAFNWAGLKDEGVYEAVDTARTTTDKTKRKEMYRKVQENVLNTGAYGFLFNRPIKQAVRKEVQNLGYEGGGGWFFTETWLNK